MENKHKIIYWISTGLLSLMALMAASMYVFKHDMVSQMFISLGYPTYIIYPLATAKVLGVIAIVTRKSAFLKNLAYAGFFYNTLLAFSAHLAVGDGEFWGALVAFVLVITSYIFEKKVFGKKHE